jgi:hypothetical protein
MPYSLWHTKATGQKPEVSGQRAKGRGKRAGARGERLESGGQRVGGGRQRAEGRRQRTEGSGQKVEASGQRLEARGSRPEIKGQRPVARGQRPKASDLFSGSVSSISPKRKNRTDRVTVEASSCEQQSRQRKNPSSMAGRGASGGHTDELNDVWEEPRGGEHHGPHGEGQRTELGHVLQEESGGGTGRGRNLGRIAGRLEPCPPDGTKRKDGKCITIKCLNWNPGGSCFLG